MKRSFAGHTLVSGDPIPHIDRLDEDNLSLLTFAARRTSTGNPNYIAGFWWLGH